MFCHKKDAQNVVTGWFIIGQYNVGLIGTSG